MGKMGKGLVAVVALAAAAWAGGWFYVKGKIPQAIAQQTAALKAQGLEVAHGPVTVTGFPFRHDARIENVVATATRDQLGQKVVAATTIPWIEGSWAMFSPSKGRVTGIAETSRVDVTMGERRFAGDLKIANLRGAVDGSDSRAAAYDLAADSFGLTLAGALTDAQKLLPGPRDVSVRTGPVTLKGTTGGAETFENVLADLVTTVRSSQPNPDFTQEGLVESVATLGLSSLTARGSRQGETRTGELLLPALIDLKVKTGELPEVAIPMKSTNARLNFVDAPEKIDFTLSGDALSYAMTQSEGPISVSSDAGYGKFEFKGHVGKATLAEFDPARLEAGAIPDFSKVDFRVAYKADDSHVLMKSTPNEAAEPDPFNAMPPIPAFDLDVRTGRSDGVIAVEKGVFDLSGVSAANVFTFSGPAEVSGEIGNMVAKINGPLLAAEAPQPFVVEYDLDKVTLNEGAWDLIDPTGALDRQINRLRLAFSGDLTLNASLGDQETLEAAMAAGKEPVFPNRVKIDDVTIDALGLVARASGEAAFDAANPAAPPRGAAVASLRNWSPFLTSLANAGFVPPDAVGMAEGMIGMLGETNEAGETIFNVVAGEDGVLTVNGNPLGELPGIGGPSLEPSSDDEWPLEEELPLDEEEFDGVEEQELPPIIEAPAPLTPGIAPAPAIAPEAPAPVETAPQEAVPAPAPVAPGTEGSLQDLRQNLEQGAHELHQEAGQELQRLEEGARESLEGLQEALPGGEQIRRDAEQGVEGLQQGLQDMREGLPSVDQLRQGAEEGAERLQQGVEEGADRLRQGVEEGVQRLENGVEQLREEVDPTHPSTHQ
ncbi:DUF2125 domain-containing protein [Neomegalonema sp.]|uniref:DUF2125 domain-containing protein n=1 Tax=Neomegalonema sp. TaxID=2039713 RepID=UPI00262796C5|nr:DUF2125 domain-containing protein [Neomegalonema sp.]MDD2867222.1 DUF2125 domain-containing protein [Neomegalonema sp.]